MLRNTTIAVKGGKSMEIHIRQNDLGEFVVDLGNQGVYSFVAL